MDAESVLDRIIELLDDADNSTVNTSMRLPSALREAASMAVDHLGVAASTTAMTADALRTTVETAVMEAALEARFQANPALRPSLGDVAVALAQQDGLEVAERPELIREAAVEVAKRHPNADADDVLLWVEAQSAMVTT